MTSYLARIFGSSPVAPLQAHMDRVYQCAKQLIALFNAGAEDVSGLVVGRRMRLPPQISALFLALVARSIDAVKKAHKSARELDETGFGGAEALRPAS